MPARVGKQTDSGGPCKDADACVLWLQPPTRCNTPMALPASRRTPTKSSHILTTLPSVPNIVPAAPPAWHGPELQVSTYNLDASWDIWLPACAAFVALNGVSPVSFQESQVLQACSSGQTQPVKHQDTACHRRSASAASKALNIINWLPIGSILTGQYVLQAVQRMCRPAT